MKNCSVCGEKLKDGYIVGCANCGYTTCDKCKGKTKGICPNCYSNLEYIG